MDAGATASARSGTKSAERGPGRESLTPQHWIDCASALLIDHGIDAVRIDALAKTLGVTRGSFYWHFRDREDLLHRVLKAWRDAATDQVIAHFESETSDPRELLRLMITLPFRGRSAAKAASFELAIRAWARRDELARGAVDEVDARRIAYHAQCFSALGFGIGEARARAFILYGYEVAESLLFGQGTDGQKMERSKLLESLLIR
jgi:AcrR family transcriptional regulator